MEWMNFELPVKQFAIVTNNTLCISENNIIHKKYVLNTHECICKTVVCASVPESSRDLLPNIVLTPLCNRASEVIAFSPLFLNLNANQIECFVMTRRWVCDLIQKRATNC